MYMCNILRKTQKLYQILISILKQNKNGIKKLLRE